MDVEVHQGRSLADYREGRRVIAAAWRAAFADIVDPDALDRMDEWAEESDVGPEFDEMRNADGMALRVAQVDDRIVGTTMVSWDPERTKDFVGDGDAEIRSLYVHPDCWGQGVGTALLEAIESLVPPSVERCVLQTLAENAHGRRFYEARGFELVGEHRFDIADMTYPTVIYARSR